MLEGDFWWDEDVIKLKDEVEILIRDVATEDIDMVLESFKQSKEIEAAKISSVRPHTPKPVHIKIPLTHASDID